MPVKSLSHVQLCDPRTAAHQAPPSMGFSRQEHWSGLPFPSPGDADALPSKLPGKPIVQQPYFKFKKAYGGTSQGAQWLRLCTPNARCPCSTPGQGIGSHTPQLKGKERYRTPRLNILCAATKTQSSQVSKERHKY